MWCSMNVSSYVYGTSFYHRFDVRPKLIATLAFSIIAFIVSSHAGLLLVFLIPVLIMLLSVGRKETWHCYSRLLPLFVLIILFAPLQERSGEVLFSAGGFVLATREGVESVLRIIARLGGISGALMLLLLTERNEMIIKGLRAFHMPYNAALAASMILRFIPYLGELFAEIRDSMSLRLEEGRRGYPILPSITALVVASIRMIPETASSLEERGFGLRKKAAGVALKRPEYYLIQCLISAIILLSLLILG